MDFVEEVLKFLTARMQIEEEWAVQERTSFTWWAHTLAQRVWVAEPREFQGVELRTLHIETDLLRDVPIDSSTWSRLSNGAATGRSPWRPRPARSGCDGSSGR